MLAFPLVHQPQRVPVGASKGFVNVEHSLNEILAGLDAIQVLTGITQRRSVDDGIARAVHIDSEHLLRFECLGKLEARFRRVCMRQDQSQMAIHRLLPRYLKPQRGPALRRESTDECQGG